MKKFQFTLETALRWRQMKADQEKAKVEAIAGEITRIDNAKLALDQEILRIDREMKAPGGTIGRDLHAFDAFVSYASERRILLEARKLECRRRLEEQQRYYMEARREAELLIKLKTRRHAAWEREAAAELEALAADAYIAKLIREAAREDG